MLVLERKTDQRIFLDLTGYGIKEPIAIMVTRVRGDHVWLGISCPRDIPVHREEVYRDIESQRRGEARE